MTYIKHLFIALILIFQPCRAEVAPHGEAVLECIQTELPHQGILKNSSGFVYVDIDDAYVHRLIALIGQDGFEEPPYFGRADLVGAHITLIYPEEVKKYGIGEVEEVGEMIYFTPKECQVVYPTTFQGVEAVYLVTVEAPQLDQIREKYGLPKRKYDFHITVGVRLQLQLAN